MKLKHLILVTTSGLFAALSLQSCVKEKDLYQEAPATYSELNLKLDGDFILTEEPLGRSVTRATSIDESKAIVGIGITMSSIQDGKTVSKPYAYGIFELSEAQKKDKLKINVIDGYTYKVTCAMIANAKDSIKVSSEGKYYAPFDLESKGTIAGECLNKFVTAEQPNQTLFLHNLENSKIRSATGTQDNYTHPFIERYNGSIESLSVQSGVENVLKLYRRYFGVNFKQTGLQEGRLKIQLDGAPIIYLDANADKSKLVESGLKLVSMKNLSAALPATGSLTEGIKLDVFWEKTPGITEKQIIGTNISFKRNYKHNLVITDIDHMGTPGNIGIEVDEEEMKDDYQQDLPWQGDSN